MYSLLFFLGRFFHFLLFFLDAGRLFCVRPGIPCVIVGCFHFLVHGLGVRCCSCHSGHLHLFPILRSFPLAVISFRL
ncbi:hypothetical protein B0H65DRAFT_472343 [Neurospora tetraspora]|uniref:Secreted protein n=1 Tax=Neurospora tetraspora TaxID=94610 RepID=A0AAE0JAK6_9PEZI|nr:hypothetical protein B0H65DRAFT_472343 [Neurospora tetraspora]